MVELEAALPPLARDVGGDVDEQALLLVLAEEQPDLPGSAPRASQLDVSHVLPRPWRKLTERSNQLARTEAGKLAQAPV
ncbi:hypothetical protein Ade02nite_92720 [Paractinoplanes deccanensis]|uniref:Uncharacterized protein n=1 Tax=Paractinoplanes deccanensis TaxID=113561 RepID=A0ABQ3YKV6_9ACTN|nr:hypothetical protein Ade02nite_92720 [Actinoplanes deccanensis]